MLQKGRVFCKCLVGGASKWKHGMKLQKKVDFDGGELVVEAAITGRLADSFVIELSWQPADLSFAEVLHLVGFIPLPPYLHRAVEEDDKTRYQTIYAKYDGSVAAPTAGLHFTDGIFEQLAAKNVHRDFVTLHVGAGTFKPVKAETIDEHEMHAEFIDVSAETIENLRKHTGKAIVAVGTTSLRTIESLYWMGVKVERDPGITIDKLMTGQWEPYESVQPSITTEHALGSLLQWMSKRGMKRLITRTQILIAPGYDLKVAAGIVTNFHQPQSTLLLLVAAIVGPGWKNIYDFALRNGFRFLSYGDGCLLWNEAINDPGTTGTQ
jgi:S-adenosylmethionine:tRNA ribosyltransferase-isomerase